MLFKHTGPLICNQKIRTGCRTPTEDWIWWWSHNKNNMLEGAVERNWAGVPPHTSPSPPAKYPLKPHKSPTALQCGWVNSYDQGLSIWVIIPSPGYPSDKNKEQGNHVLPFFVVLTNRVSHTARHGTFNLLCCKVDMLTEIWVSGSAVSSWVP